MRRDSFHYLFNKDDEEVWNAKQNSHTHKLCVVYFPQSLEKRKKMLKTKKAIMAENADA